MATFLSLFVATLATFSAPKNSSIESRNRSIFIFIKRDKGFFVLFSRKTLDQNPLSRFADGHGPRQSRRRSSQPLARLPAGDLTYLPEREAWLGQNGQSPSCYRRRRRSSQTPHCFNVFAVQNHGYRAPPSADGPRLFRFRVCPRRSKFLMRIRHQPTSAAFARYCGRRFTAISPRLPLLLAIAAAVSRSVCCILRA